jgi:hypothetical protein
VFDYSKRKRISKTSFDLAISELVVIGPSRAVISMDDNQYYLCEYSNRPTARAIEGLQPEKLEKTMFLPSGLLLAQYKLGENAGYEFQLARIEEEPKLAFRVIGRFAQKHACLNAAGSGSPDGFVFHSRGELLLFGSTSKK